MTTRTMATIAILLAACTGPATGTITDRCAEPWPPQTLCGGAPYRDHPPRSWCAGATRGESVIVTLPHTRRDYDYCGTCTDAGVEWDRCDAEVCLRYGCRWQRS